MTFVGIYWGDAPRRLSRTAETAEEFERLVISSPNSSYIWIKYMAFHLGMH
jgi:rRNA biogenesis protein RRP5